MHRAVWVAVGVILSASGLHIGLEMACSTTTYEVFGAGRPLEKRRFRAHASPNLTLDRSVGHTQSIVT
jgi:hypothetical protein